MPLRVTELFIFCVVCFLFLLGYFFQFSFLSYSNCTRYFNDKRSKMDVESVYCVYLFSSRKTLWASLLSSAAAGPLQAEASRIEFPELSNERQTLLLLSQHFNVNPGVQLHRAVRTTQHNTTPFGSHSACCILLQQCQIYCLELVN